MSQTQGRVRVERMFQKIRLWTILVLILGMSGCATMNAGKPIPGVPQPAERTRQIRELGKNASKIPPENQTEYAQTLATIVHEETDALLRREAVLSIAHFHVPLSEETLVFAENDSDRDVREALCAAWLTYGGDAAVTQLIHILATETDLDIQHSAIDALGELGDSRAIAALEVPLGTKDPALQHFTMIALQKITGQKLKTQQEWLAYCREHRGSSSDRAVAAAEESETQTPSVP